MQAKSASNVRWLDASKFQGNVDWKRVKAAGVVGAFIKATEGIGYVDPKFDQYAKDVVAAGLEVGFYHYAHPETNKAMQDVDAFLSVVKGHPDAVVYVLDLEGKAGQLSNDALTTWADTWLSEVHKRTGKTVMLYTGAAFARRLGRQLSKYPLWVAHYGVDKPMDDATWDRWSVFQFTSSGHIDGINGVVDLDVMEASFMAELHGEDRRFSDVNPNAWYASAVEQAASDGLLGGYPDGTFKPSESVTRAQLAVVLTRLKQAGIDVHVDN